MNTESRLSVLAESIGTLATDSLAMDRVLRALIATHPDPMAVAKELEQNLMPDDLGIRDRGFERRSNVATTAESAEDYRAELMVWIGIARKAHE